MEVLTFGRDFNQPLGITLSTRTPRLRTLMLGRDFDQSLQGALLGRNERQMSCEKANMGISEQLVMYMQCHDHEKTKYHLALQTFTLGVGNPCGEAPTVSIGVPSSRRVRKANHWISS